MVKKYKYGRQQRLDQPLSSLLAAAIRGQPWADQIDALVPVPTGWRSWLHYRFRPIHQLAAGVGRELSIPALPLIYVRGKKHKQVDLSHTERAKNVRGVFHLKSQARINKTKLCVIDDVFTSGSTLQEMARVLKKAGATQVFGAVLAKTRPDESDRINY